MSNCYGGSSSVLFGPPGQKTKRLDEASVAVLMQAVPTDVYWALVLFDCALIPRGETSSWEQKRKFSIKTK